MRAVDCLNQTMGRETVGFAAAGLPGASGPLGRSWTMQQDGRTPRYTTCWDELPVAYAVGEGRDGGS
jgi:DNA polymerase V